MLSEGCAIHIDAIHGELVFVLSGVDAGKTFIGVRENSSDITLDSEMMTDVRAKRLIRFRDRSVPRLAKNDIIKTEDGKRWHAIKSPQDGYLTTDFELVEITSKDQ